jgi:hypothetical protein
MSSITDPTIPIYALTPDRSLVGDPLLLHISNKGIDDDVVKAAEIAISQPGVGIIAVRFTADPGLRSQVNGWLDRQRRALAAWRVTSGISGQKGRLSLRSLTATDEDTGSDWVWSFAQWDPIKEKDVDDA